MKAVGPKLDLLKQAIEEVLYDLKQGQHYIKSIVNIKENLSVYITAKQTDSVQEPRDVLSS
jgi:hypothetical protein